MKKKTPNLTKKEKVHLRLLGVSLSDLKYYAARGDIGRGFAPDNDKAINCYSCYSIAKKKRFIQ